MDHWPQLYQRYHLDDVEVILFTLKNTFLKQKKVILKLKHVSMPEYWYYFTQCCCSRSYLIFSKRDLFWRWRGPTFETWKVPFWTKKRYLFESKRYLFQTKSTIFFNFVAQKGTCKTPFSTAEKWNHHPVVCTVENDSQLFCKEYFSQTFIFGRILNFLIFDVSKYIYTKSHKLSNVPS